jgi:hypothetical protein
MRICYFRECGGTFQVLFLNRRGHKINFVCHLCLLVIKNHALFLLTRMKELVLLESLSHHGTCVNWDAHRGQYILPAPSLPWLLRSIHRTVPLEKKPHKRLGDSHPALRQTPGHFVPNNASKYNIKQLWHMTHSQTCLHQPCVRPGGLFLNELEGVELLGIGYFMPIQARLDASGILHPIMGYWIERTKIFKFIQKWRPIEHVCYFQSP